jgi:hypothetical protein
LTLVQRQARRICPTSPYNLVRLMTHGASTRSGRAFHCLLLECAHRLARARPLGSFFSLRLIRLLAALRLRFAMRRDATSLNPPPPPTFNARSTPAPQGTPNSPVSTAPATYRRPPFNVLSHSRIILRFYYTLLAPRRLLTTANPFSPSCWLSRPDLFVECYILPTTFRSCLLGCVLPLILVLYPRTSLVFSARPVCPDFTRPDPASTQARSYLLNPVSESPSLFFSSPQRSSKFYILPPTQFYLSNALLID